MGWGEGEREGGGKAYRRRKLTDKHRENGGRGRKRVAGGSEAVSQTQVDP